MPRTRSSCGARSRMPGSSRSTSRRRGRCPGVFAVYGAGDLEGGLENAMAFEVVSNRDGSDGAAPRRPMLADDRVRHLGEAVAMVVAETRMQATDAAEAVEVDYDDLPVHVATAPGGPEIHPEAPGNVGYDWAFGDEARVAATFERAAHRTRLEMIDNRVFAMPMEPRGCFAEWDGERLHVGFSGQGVWGAEGRARREARARAGAGAGHHARTSAAASGSRARPTRSISSSPSPPVRSGGRSSG